MDYCGLTRKAFRSQKKRSCAETAGLTLFLRTAKETFGSGVREGWAALGTVRSLLIHLLAILVSRTVDLYMLTRTDAHGWLPPKVGCMFSRMDALNPLRLYHQTRSSTLSVDAQMWCGSDVNAGD